MRGCAKPPNPLTGIAIYPAGIVSSIATSTLTCWIWLTPPRLWWQYVLPRDAHAVVGEDLSHGKIRGLTMTGNLDTPIATFGNFSSPEARAHIEGGNAVYSTAWAVGWG